MRNLWASIGPFEQWAVIGLASVLGGMTLALWLLPSG